MCHRLFVPIRYKKDVKGLNYAFSKRDVTLPAVLSATEARLVIDNLNGVHKLIASLLYGSGLRINEALKWQLYSI